MTQAHRMHPLNLGLRLLLEVNALVALGRWGYSQGEGADAWLLAIALPVAAAALWGTLAVPGDPSRGKPGLVRVSGALRLLLELLVLGGGGAALYALDERVAATVHTSVLVAHYALSWRRLGWLLQQ